MITIEMGNVVSKLNGLTEEQSLILMENLSYNVGGFGMPKETKYVYNALTNMTYTGLVPKTIGLIQKLFNVEYTIIDHRSKPESNANFNITKGFDARDYQAEIINRSSSREILQAATGAGKTFIMASLIAKYDVKPTIVIAPKISLAEQIREEFKKFLGIEIGIVGGGKYDIKDITVCTPQSALNANGGDLIRDAKAILFDEAHNIPSNTIFNIANKAVNAYYRVGVSATPWRDGEDDILIEAALNIRKPHLSINASKLISKNKLVPCTINFVRFDNSNLTWDGNYGSTYDKAIALNVNRNNTILDIAKSLYEQNRTTLILIQKIVHGEFLLNSLKNSFMYEETTYTEPVSGKTFNIGNVAFLSGEDSAPYRKTVMDCVKNGFIKILIGSTIADEGLDLPILDALILAGAGKSSTRAFQRIGRVLRLYKGKKDAVVYDFMDLNKTFYRHALIRKALYETEPLWKINVI